MSHDPIDQSSRKPRRKVLWIVGSVVILAVAGCLWPEIVRQKKAADRTSTIGRLKGIGLSLQEFREEYGRFPDEITASIVKEVKSSPLDLTGNSSNRLFRQLLLNGLPETEFYTPVPGFRRGDDRFDSDTTALAPGECGFSYLTGNGNNSWGPAAVVVIAPLISGTTKFKPSPFEGKCVLIREDCSASALIIQQDGRVEAGDGNTEILDPSYLYWNGAAPVLHWPEEAK